MIISFEILVSSLGLTWVILSLWCPSAGQTANGNGPTFDINDPAGWELALVTNPTDSATAAEKHSKLVSGLRNGKHVKMDPGFGRCFAFHMQICECWLAVNPGTVLQLDE